MLDKLFWSKAKKVPNVTYISCYYIHHGEKILFGWELSIHRLHQDSVKLYVTSNFFIKTILDEDEEKLPKLDVELIGQEIPSDLSQPREQEIDIKINLEEFIYVTERLLGEAPHP